MKYRSNTKACSVVEVGMIGFCLWLVPALVLAAKEIPAESFTLEIEGAVGFGVQNISGATHNNDSIIIIDDGGAKLPNNIFIWTGRLNQARIQLASATGWFSPK